MTVQRPVEYLDIYRFTVVGGEKIKGRHLTVYGLAAFDVAISGLEWFWWAGWLLTIG